MMFGACERSQFLNHALNMFWFVSRIFFESEVVFTHPVGLLSLFRPNFNLFGVIRSIASKSETILPIAKGKSLILFAISSAQVSDWMTEKSFVQHGLLDRLFNFLYFTFHFPMHIMLTNWTCFKINLYVLTWSRFDVTNV